MCPVVGWRQEVLAAGMLIRRSPLVIPVTQEKTVVVI